MKGLLKWSLFSLAFVPLLVNSNTLFPFIFTKVLLVRSVAAVFWVVFAVWFFFKREDVLDLIRERIRFIKNPVFIFTVIYMALMFLSTIFAVNSFKAFFGDIERGEGFLGILNFFSFFMASLLIFDRKDWVTFLKLNLITGAVLFFDALGEIVGNEFGRAQSTTGNPTFLAGYFLFIILAAFVVVFSNITKPWRLTGFAMIFLGTGGVFLTGTRGAILGLLAGAVLVAVYFAVKKSEPLNVGNFSVSIRKVSVALLALGILMVSGFALTKDNPFWQKIPGVDRFATISLTDSTLQTRLISAGVSLDSVNPAQNGIGRFLIGYGPDNFNIAYNKHYNPEYLKYENLWFDRAHDKVFDVLVMQGIFGLLAYLGIWISLIYLAFRRIRERWYAAPILFFAVAYFVQNIFVFDQVTTYTPFFALLALSVFASSGDPPKEDKRISPKVEKFLPYKFTLVGVFFVVTFVLYSVIPYFQSITFISLLKGNESVEDMTNKIDSFTTPFNYAQGELRNRLVQFTLPGISNPQTRPLADKAILLFEEYVADKSYDPRDFVTLANAYRLKGQLGEPSAYARAEELYLRAVEFSPLRQDHWQSLATIAADQGDFEKSMEYAQKMLEISPGVARTKIYYGSTISRIGPDKYAEGLDILNSALDDPLVYIQETEAEILTNIYNMYARYFYELHDEEHFLATLHGLKQIQIIVEKIKQTQLDAGRIEKLPPKQSEVIQGKIDLFNETGWDSVEIQ